MKTRWSIGLIGAALFVTAAPAFATVDAAPSIAQFKPRGDGAVIATATGMTLYTFGRDQTPGKSACNGGRGRAKTAPPAVQNQSYAPYRELLVNPLKIIH